MTGPQHYREAGRLVSLAAATSRERPDWAAEYLAAAQVNATLALAAATALSRFGDLPAYDSDAWMAAAATPRPAESSPDQ
ncbi:MAG TPA: hypothetical protein VK586_16200 [Streptosporangiaceae bacterium]|nr:hypothetical protein [Streptosporangiaceae bacterium]